MIYNKWEHASWGNRISPFEWISKEPPGKVRINGHLPRKPKVGDEIRFEMETNKIARFKVTNTEYMGDPHDMFFADLEPIDYLKIKDVDISISEAPSEDDLNEQK